MNDQFQIPALDGVRGIALLIVLLAHTNPQVFPGGNIGVDLFFVLSGFLITTILLQEYRATGTISISKFYARRALRLLPALFLMVILVTVFIWVLGNKRAFEIAIQNSPAIILYWWNWWLALGWKPQLSEFRHLWSLSVEEQFYITWPFVLLLTIARPKVFGALLAIGILGPAIARLLLWESGPSLHLYFRTDLRFDSLMWGAAGAWLHFNRPNVATNMHIVGLVALALFMGLCRFNLLANGMLYLGGYTLMLATAAIFVVAACGQRSALTNILELRPLRWTGKISYGLYLWHVPMFYLSEELPVSVFSQNVLAILLSYLVAAASFYGMERYFLALKPSHYSKSQGNGRASLSVGDLRGS